LLEMRGRRKAVVGLGCTVAIGAAIAVVATGAFGGAEPAPSTSELPPAALPPTEPLPRGEEPPPLDPALEKSLFKLEPAARQRWPDTFAGLWITGETPRDEIYITFTENAEENVAALAQDFPYPEMLRPWTFERSLRELEVLQREMGEDRELVAEGELEIPGLPDGRYDLSIDITQNAATATVEELEAETAAWFAERYGDAVVVEEGPLAELAVGVAE
jgi:hypothetical protein